MKKIWLTLLLCMAAIVASAQNVNFVNDLGIAPEEADAIRERIVAKVNELQSNIQDMAGIGTMSHKGKMDKRDITLKLFIADGKRYTAKVPHKRDGYQYYEDTICQAMMSVINTKNKKNGRQVVDIISYFDHLIKNSETPNYRYKKVVIEAADAVRVDNLSRTGDGQYMATAHILQHFAGYNAEGRLIYHDYTAKIITIYIQRMEVNTEEGTMSWWEIRLGDIDCNDIWG